MTESLDRSYRLEVNDLTVEFPGHNSTWVAAVRGVSLAVASGEFVGLVGESGSGKSVTALTCIGLTPPPGRVAAGKIRLDGRALAEMGPEELRKTRGGEIGYVFQEPMTALNPVFTIGFQICEAIRAHHPCSRKEAKEKAVALLEEVAIPNPQKRVGNYPHELSGGQRQRAMIAMALAAEPRLLIADEPTTALDVTIQAQVLDLFERLRRERDLGVLLITHDLGVVAETCERVVVMYAGEVVEEADVDRLFQQPRHPYTQALLRALPRVDEREDRLTAIDGQIPALGSLPQGCAFAPRCSDAFEPCTATAPQLYEVDSGGSSRCFLEDPTHRRPST